MCYHFNYMKYHTETFFQNLKKENPKNILLYSHKITHHSKVRTVRVKSSFAEPSGLISQGQILTVCSLGFIPRDFGQRQRMCTMAMPSGGSTTSRCEQTLE